MMRGFFCIAIFFSLLTTGCVNLYEKEHNTKNELSIFTEEKNYDNIYDKKMVYMETVILDPKTESLQSDCYSENKNYEETTVELIYNNRITENIEDEKPNEIINDYMEYGYISSMFNPKDTLFLDISLLDIVDSLIDIMGEPDNIEAVFEGYFNEYVYYYYYDFGYVRLEPGDKYYISRISVTNENYFGPRGLKIGDTYEQVIDKFFIDYSLTEDVFFGERYLYHGHVEDDIRGSVIYDNKGNINRILYTYYIATGEDNYGLGFNIKDGKIVSFGVWLLYS
jgi:hypothetical protein